MRHVTKIALASLTAIALSAPSVTAQQGRGGIAAYIRSLPMQTIDAQELADLEALRQEEKVARDVYLVLDMVWGGNTFANIAQSEQSHMDLVKLIFDRYGLADPLPNEDLGVYRDQHFRDLFEVLAIFGLQSRLHAAIVGELIEDLDIVDVEVALARTDNRDIGTVWQNLARGSRNHLRAYYTVLGTMNFVYTPIFLTPADYTAIVTSAQEPFPVDENGNRLP